MKRNFIKMLLLILSLTILNVAKAQTIIQESGKKYSEIFDSLATGLIPSRIPYGKLNDRTAGWVGWVSCRIMIQPSITYVKLN